MNTSGAARARPRLAIIVPCFNEHEVLRLTVASLLEELRKMAGERRVADDSYLLFIDDGSTDDTWDIISEAHRQSGMVRGLKLSRNFGHQAALSAGLTWVVGKCDCAVSIDADLQQDEKAITGFLEAYAAGNEIVYGVREDREADTAFKSLTARLFYGLMRLQGVPIIPNHADYRLMSAKALAALSSFTEGNIFLRGIIVQEVGMKSTIVHFGVRQRAAGKTKYSLRKMLSFALNGITSFSVAPLRLVFGLGVAFTVLSVIMSAYILVMAILGDAVPGWASTVLPIYVLGGVQLASIGIIGEYIGRIYREVKRRPRFIVENELVD